MAAQIAGASSEPLNESGAITTIGGRDGGMAYDFFRSATRAIVAASRSPWMRPCPGSRYTHYSLWPRPRWRRGMTPTTRARNAGRRRSCPRSSSATPCTSRRRRASACSRFLTMPSGAAAGGVVVVHGLGVHPDWGLIGGLRSGLADAGYVTLSVQMPVLAATATRDDYAPTLPEAGGADRRRGGLCFGRRASRRSPSFRTAWAPRWPTPSSRDPRRRRSMRGRRSACSARSRWRRRSRCSTSSRKGRSPWCSASAPARMRDAAEGRVLAPGHDRRRRSLFRGSAEGARRGDRGILGRAQRRLLACCVRNQFASTAIARPSPSIHALGPAPRSRSLVRRRPAVARSSRSRTASQASPSGTASTRMTSAFAASSPRRFA